MVEKQAKFRAMVLSRQAEFYAMDPETRAAVYDELKRKEFGQ